MLLCNSGHGFFILRQKKTEFGFFGYQECFFQPLPPDLLASRRQPGLQSSFGLCHCHWKNGTWIFWDPRCGFERSMRKTSRASGVLQEIIHLISWGSSDFPWLDFRSKFHPLFFYETRGNPMFCSKQVLVIPSHSTNHGVDFVPNDFGIQNTVSP